MSRGGRGGFRGGKPGGFGGARPEIPAGLTYADLANMPRTGTPLYPPIDDFPTLAKITDAERETCRQQIGFTTRCRNSPYYVAEEQKKDHLERYSDKFRPTFSKRAALNPELLNKEFFPTGIWDGYFNARKKPKISKSAKQKGKVDWNQLGIDPEGGGENESDQASQDGEGDAEDQQDDYDEENEEDADYANNYFDNGEGDNDDDLGDGDVGEGGGDEGYE